MFMNLVMAKEDVMHLQHTCFLLYHMPLSFLERGAFAFIQERRPILFYKKMVSYDTGIFCAANVSQNMHVERVQSTGRMLTGNISC